MAVIRTAQAEEDLIAIWVYIAQDNPRAADQVLDDIDATCSTLARHPGMGRVLVYIHESLQYFPVRNYPIFYRTLATADVEIMRVLHSARDWQEILSQQFDA